MSDPTIQQIPLTQIIAGNNDRKRFDAVALQELASSIKTHGLAQPITIRRLDLVGLASTCGVLPTYQIVAGERRFRAHQLISAESIPAIIRILTDEEASAIMLVENTGRADLDPIDEANAYQSRIDRYSWSITKIATTAGVSAVRVRGRIKLLSLHPDVQHLVAHSNIPLGHAERMATLDHNRQLIALRVLTDGKPLTLKQFGRMVGELEAEQNQSQLIDLSTLWIELSQQAETITTRGKSAVINVPIALELPKVQAANNTSETIANYITLLTQVGNAEAAAAIGTMYTALIKFNFMTIAARN